MPTNPSAFATLRQLQPHEPFHARPRRRWSPPAVFLATPRQRGRAWAPVEHSGINTKDSDGTAAGNYGEDHVWPWADVLEFDFNYFGVLQ